MKQLLRALALTLTLSAAVPAPVFAAAAAAPAPRQDNSECRMFGYVALAIMAIGGLWWKFWGKKEFKRQNKPYELVECSFCKIDYEDRHLITLHPNTREYIASNMPQVEVAGNAAYNAQSAEFNRARLRDLPKEKKQHKACAACVIRIFKSAYRGNLQNIGQQGNDEAGTCMFHMGLWGNAHGHCKLCNNKAACLYCPCIFKEVVHRDAQGKPAFYEHQKCKVRLNLNWIINNNPHMFDAIDAVFEDAETASAQKTLWTMICDEFPTMLQELQGAGTLQARLDIANRYYQRWNAI